MKARRSIRLKGYDYSRNGAYFVTICTQGRQCLFGNVMEEKMVLNDAGEIVKSVVNDLPNHYMHVELDQYVIMPNHFHGIIMLTGNVGAGFKPALGLKQPVSAGLNHNQAGLKPAQFPVRFPQNNKIANRAGLKPAPTKRHGLPEIVRGLKTFSSRRINDIRNTPGAKTWQQNYYEHIIRNDDELHRIRKYINNNPVQWHTDPENPAVSNTNPTQRHADPENSTISDTTPGRGGFETRPWIETTRSCGIEPQSGGFKTCPIPRSNSPKQQNCKQGGFETRPYAKSPKPWKA